MAPNARKELTEKQVAYVVWAATPEGIREPETRDEFALLFGLSRQTVWRWSKDPRVLDAIRFVVLQNAGDPRRVNKVLDMVYDKAIADGNLKAAELWIKAVGITSQFTRGSSILDALEEDDSFADFSTEELERLRDEAKAQGKEDINVNRAKEMLAANGVPDAP